MKCFYHNADLDGHCSGAIVKHFEPEAELIGFNYGYDFPWDTIDPEEKVYMVDVSLPINDMVKLARLLGESGGALIWIDHHIGIIREWRDLPWETKNLFGGTLNEEFAACELCWKYFSDDPVPAGVEHLGIYDSWRFEPGNEERLIKQFQYGMRLNAETRPEKSMVLWDSMLNNGEDSTVFQEAHHAGRIIYSYQVTQNEKTCRSCAFETRLFHIASNPTDHKRPLWCVAVNSNLMNSDVFKSVYDPVKHDAMLCFYRSKRGFWRVSIYSDRDDVDCSVYAKSYGGGGHKGAAGFQVDADKLPFALNSDAVSKGIA